MRQRLNDHLGAISKSVDCAEHVQIHPNRLSKPPAICAASNDLLFCSDDESQYVYQITLTFDGVTILGNATKFTAYPSSIVNLFSVTLLDQCAFFSGASSQGGVYKCELSTKTVTQAVCNSTLPCSEVNQVCALNGKVVYTDTNWERLCSTTLMITRLELWLGRKWPQQFFRWDTRFMLIQTNRGDILRRQDFVCYRCFRWKSEDSDKPLRNDIFSGDSCLPPFCGGAVV